jgi:thiamine biosynthesis protein ThiS
MEIIINQQKVQVHPGITLANVLRDYGAQQPKGTAVAVNETVIPKKQWDITVLQPNDRIIVVKAAQGG